MKKRGTFLQFHKSIMEMNMEKTESWEREAIKKLAESSLREQRSSRRWSVFFKIVFLAYLLGVTFLLFRGTDSLGVQVGQEHVALIELFGEINAGNDASAEEVISGLREAFASAGTEGVILQINSPGGSPVHSRRIFLEIANLRLSYPEIPIHAVVEDLCASGAYYVAVAADKIHVDPSSIVGSIGVVYSGFGLQGSLEKLGIERRLYTSGKDKGFMDPFSDLNEDHKKHIRSMLAQIHQQFKDDVFSRRGDKVEELSTISTGLVWTGRKAIEVGLADEIGTVETVSRSVFGNDNVINFSSKTPMFEKLLKELSSTIANVKSIFETAQTYILR